MAVLQLGDISVQRIVEHEIPVYLPSDMFDEATPEAIEPYREWLEPKALCPRTGRLVMPVLSYLVRTRHHCILIDTCVGCQKSYAEPPEWHQRRNEDWLSNLEAAGVHPEDVDYVFCTHLHSDHCGWNTRLVDGRWVPTFPKAKYVFSRDEYAEIEAENSLIFIENVQPILEANQAVLVDIGLRAGRRALARAHGGPHGGARGDSSQVRPTSRCNVRRPDPQSAAARRDRLEL